MKKQLCFLLVLLIKITGSHAQSRPGKLISASSDYTRINTFSLFEPEKKPEEKKKKEDKIEAPKDIAEKPKDKPKEKDPVPKTPKPKEGVAKPPPSDPEMIRTIYFDARENQTLKKETAVFYREAKFDKVTGQPKGIVKDFYADGGSPKFEGQYKKYEGLFENRNNDYTGKCKFYEKNGSYVVRNYSNKRITEETKYNAANQIVGQTEFALNGKRKTFSEHLFDKDGKKIGSIQGAFNPKTGREEAIRELIYENGKLKSVVELIENCPKSKAIYYTEESVRYDAYFQDFTCEPNAQWKFTNKSNFNTSPRAGSVNYKVSALNNKQEGILQMPITYDFYNKPFEIVAVFDLSELKGDAKPMNEFGIVWEYQDNLNYSYLKVNYTTKKFEVNSVRAGVTQKYMVGIRPQALEVNKGELKITFNNRDADTRRTFSLNQQTMKYVKSNSQVSTFDSFARIGEKDFKTWGVGFYFKSNAINEVIFLKSLEVKLL